MDRLNITEKGISLTGDEKTVPRFHWFHRWTEWVVTNEGKVVKKVEDREAMLGHWRLQERHCAVCNKLQIRSLQAGIWE